MYKKSDFSYSLPSDLIAKFPSPTRSKSRLLVLDGEQNIDTSFERIVDWLTPDDLLVVNDTRVIKARFQAIKDSGGRAEVLVDRIVGHDTALCQVGVSKSLNPQRSLTVHDQRILVLGRQDEFYLLQFELSVDEFLQRYGEVPLPPYLDREPELEDESRYQTVYATRKGAVAAPTAGLHFDPPLLKRIEERGVRIAKITLHVGAGTFSPIRTEYIENHTMHSERYVIPNDTMAMLRAGTHRVVAVGTTVVRTLESWSRSGETEGETDLFIQPGYEFKIVDAMVTNFHLPESSLLVLVSAFVGRARILDAYRFAIDQQYRFFSYGDAMFCERRSV